MDETTTVVTEEETALDLGDLSGALDVIKKVFDFFKTIVDTLAGFIEPVFEDLLRNIL